MARCKIHVFPVFIEGALSHTRVYAACNAIFSFQF
jgi:hypothetical protein